MQVTLFTEGLFLPGPICGLHPPGSPHSRLTESNEHGELWEPLMSREMTHGVGEGLPALGRKAWNVPRQQIPKPRDS